MARVWIALGANVGDRLENLRAAVRKLAAVATIEAVSSVYESEPVGIREQPEFLNAVLRARTRLGPRELLEALLGIEQSLGRERTVPNAPRVIDLDLLLYDDRIVTEPGLEVPHPRMLERGFVLRPLVEIDPELPHPVTGERLADHLAAARGLERSGPVLPGSALLES